MRFNPLDHPLALMLPNQFTDVPFWVGHIPFAFALIEMTEPRTVVELGTLKGDSYLAFCQVVAALQLPSKCFAVDTWQGDPQTGYYDDRVLADLRARHDPLYGGFSKLLQMEFDKALPQFADGSIDLLHIDGMHTYEAVKHDCETWLPKMSDAGVILFHDTAMRQESFGVWKLWEEIAVQYPSFNFEHSSGLGVLGVGKNLVAPLRDFFDSVSGDDSAKREEAEMVRMYFSHLGSYVQRMQIVISIVRQMHRQQTLINEWKQRVGLAVDPASNDIQTASNYAARYATNLTKEIQMLLARQPT